MATKTTFKPTMEQETCVAEAKAGHNIAISAKAGASKTTTCMLIAESVVKNSLYVCYNKSIQEEAQTKFPLWVNCRTIHSIAYQAVVARTKFVSKLSPYIDYRQIETFSVFDEDSEVSNSAIVLIGELIKEFCNTAYMTIEEFLKAKEDEYLEQGGDPNESVTNLNNDVYLNAIRIWECMCDPSHPMKITHDTYLKLFQMRNPILKDGTEPYSLIYMDECQDANPVILDIILKQPCQKILVGDEYQAIYAWRGAVNALATLPADFVRLNLSTSFRFNQDIANLANRILGIMGNTVMVKGAGSGDVEKGTKAKLVRTNLDLFQELRLCYLSNKKAYVIGDLRELFSKLYSAQNLKFDGDPTKRYDKEIASYKSWKEFMKAAEVSPDLRKIVSILASVENLHQTIVNIKSILVDDESRADVVISTAHKSKGLEWDVVSLCGGYMTEAYLDLEVEERFDIFTNKQLGNLLYVAVTRAKALVWLPDEVAAEISCLEQYKKTLG